MSETAVRATRESEATARGEHPLRVRPGGVPLRLAFVGPAVWLDSCMPGPSVSASATPAGSGPARSVLESALGPALSAPTLVCERFAVDAADGGDAADVDVAADGDAGDAADVDVAADADAGAGAGTGVARALSAARAFAPDAIVIFDPAALCGAGGSAGAVGELLRAAGGVTLGVLVGPLAGEDARADGEGARLAGALDRVVSFDPARTGTRIGGGMVWRAIAPPVGDAFYADVRALREAPGALSIGCSTEHREAMLMPAKHHHDLLQVLHGVSGAALAELLREYDVGVYVARTAGGGFGWQVGAHLAAGQLLLAGTLTPAHGLERGIDYLEVGSPDGLAYALERLARFPEMYQRIRVRGRLKAEQYRASRVFARVAHDLLADVAAFGGANA